MVQLTVQTIDVQFLGTCFSQNYKKYALFPEYNNKLGIKKRKNLFLQRYLNTL